MLDNITNPTVTCAATDNTLCVGSNGTVSAASSGVTYLWSNGSTDATQSGLVSGTYTVTVFDQSTGCTATCSATVLDNIIVPSVVCSAINNTDCSQPNGSVSATATNVSYMWNNGSTNSSISGIFAGTYTVTVTDLTTGCTASCSATVINNGTNIPATPAAISGPIVVCRNSTQTYVIALVPGANTYTWTVPTGATVTIGQGTNTATVFFSNTSISGNVTVVASNLCGSSAPRNLFVTVVPNVPAMPTITGLQRGVCGRKNIVYTCSTVAGATSYTWTVPTGATLASGQGTTSIVVHFGNTFTGSGFITVKANNVCGSSNTRSYLVHGKLSTPTIIGANFTCKFQTGVVYSCTPVIGATSYTWTVVPGSTIVSGQGTTSIVVNWGAINGVIKVKANSVSVCSESVNSTHPVSFTCRAGNEGLSAIDVYPNPANDVLNVEYDSYLGGVASIQLFNLLGEELMMQQHLSNEGLNKVTFSIDKLPAGCYILKVNSMGYTQVVKVIKN
ncbi:MAG: T9SS type A sorting domain-containing protein [Bacteroidetes bacterium]|nr:T9SS type A sorting domain-containing protein [Bacteroidota bacterium]